ncbi:MAG TPA: aldo/keto reductase [Sedimentisphaerales bacterium]|nr:aldo/keto reductase [Sedimentisphaerales bacterium]
MQRRDFLKKTFFTSTALTVGVISKESISSVFENQLNNPGCIPKRKYGKTDVMLSIIGFGGIVVTDTEQTDANRYVSEAYDRGVNYFDVAPSYGNAEIRLGPALEPYRKNVFLACKTGKRDYESAKIEFENSLKILRTDYFDLYQLHAISNVEVDVKRAFANDGVMKLLLEEKKKGRIRYLGFSAHSHAAALEAMNIYDFDSILLPVNFAGYLKGNFSPAVIEKTKEKGMAILAIKMLARQNADKNDPVRKLYPKCWYQPITDIEEAKLAMSFTMSQPVTAAVPPGDIRSFRLAADLADKIEPMNEEKLKKLMEISSELNPIFVNS